MPAIKCSYVKCNNTSKEYSMFRFPTGHASRLAVWLTNCGNMTITHLKQQELRNRYLCITHFDDKFIQNKTGQRIRLSKLAVPQNHNDEQTSVMTPHVDKLIQIKTGNRIRLTKKAVPQNHNDEQASVMTPHVDKLIQIKTGNRIRLTKMAVPLNLKVKQPSIMTPRSACASTSQAGDCKKKWQSLRDAYRRALNKKKRKRENETKNMKPWRYEAEMAFVSPFLIERKTKDSVGATSADELSDNGEENNATEINSSENPYIDIEVGETPAEISDANSTISDEVPQNESQQKDPIKPIAVKRKLDQSEPAQIRDFSSERSNVRALLMAKLVEDHNEHDELDRFFLSISDTVKKFPPYIQAVAKNKIFALVSEMELQQLAPSPQTSTSAIPTPTGPDNRNEQIQQFFQKFNTPNQTKK